MKPTKHVGAVVDSIEPAVWIVQLLQNLAHHPLLQLTIAVNDATDEKQAVSRSIASGITDWLLYRVIDTAIIDSNPWQKQSLHLDTPPLSLNDSPHALAGCDVILDLTHGISDLSFFNEHQKVWSANLATLDSRIELALLNRAPFLWIHLWDLNTSGDSAFHDDQRMASHALPCQRYSVSDLQKLSYHALPVLFMSRLNWLANEVPCDPSTFKKQLSDQGLFDEDQALARVDAISLREDQPSPAGADPIRQSHYTLLGKALSLLVQQAWYRIRKKLVAERWQLAITPTVSEQPKKLSERVSKPLQEYERLVSTTDVVCADPHLATRNGSSYVFFERMRKPNQNAHIAYAKLDKDANVLESGTALQTEGHLSFPFVFEHDGEHYMVPETGSCRSVSLYKATHFPDEWEFQHHLLEDINAADSIVFKHDNRWWLLTNCRSHVSVDERDELHVYFADKLTGPWQAHTLNPVLTGVDRARMAGPVIEEAGELFRVSQYGAYRYGYGVNLSRIDELTPSSYRESAISRLTPETKKTVTGWRGCHSYVMNEQFTIVDRVRFAIR